MVHAFSWTEPYIGSSADELKKVSFETGHTAVELKLVELREYIFDS